jgi:hypothetical protein
LLCNEPSTTALVDERKRARSANPQPPPDGRSRATKHAVRSALLTGAA